MREWEIGKIIKVAGELYEVCENDNLKGQKDVVFVKVEDDKYKEE